MFVFHLSEHTCVCIETRACVICVLLVENTERFLLGWQIEMRCRPNTRNESNIERQRKIIEMGKNVFVHVLFQTNLKFFVLF